MRACSFCNELVELKIGRYRNDKVAFTKDIIELLVELQSSKKPVSPHEVLHHLQLYCNMTPNKMHDAHEGLLYILDTISEGFKKVCILVSNSI